MNVEIIPTFAAIFTHYSKILSRISVQIWAKRPKKGIQKIIIIWVVMLLLFVQKRP